MKKSKTTKSKTSKTTRLPNYKVNERDFDMEAEALTEVEVLKLTRTSPIVFIDRREKIKKTYVLERKNYIVTEEVHSLESEKSSVTISSNNRSNTNQV